MNYARMSQADVLEPPHGGASTESDSVRKGLREVRLHRASAATSSTRRIQGPPAADAIFEDAWAKTEELILALGETPAEVVKAAGASLRAWQGKELPIGKDEA
jgi:hypothetical protein